MDRKIFIINGLPDSGKRTVVNLIQELIPNVSYLSYIEPVKKIAKEMGWDGTMNDVSRGFLSDIEQLWSNYNDELIFNITNRIKEEQSFYSGSHYWFISVRRPEQIDKLKILLSPCNTLLITRPNVKVPNNIADRLATGSYKYDYYINNNKDLYSLRKKTIRFIDKYIGKRLLIIQ